MKLYCKLGKKTDSLDHLHKAMYAILKYMPISLIPSTSRAFRSHMLSAHLEVKTRKGWKKKIMVLREMSMDS